MTDRLVWIDCEMTGLDLRPTRSWKSPHWSTDSELTVLATAWTW